LWKYFSSHTQGPGIWKWEHYLDAYERHLSRFRGRAVTLVEIGIYSGGSLPMWRAYLGNDCTVYGVDIQPECIQYQSEGIHVVIGDQADRAFWRQFKQSVPHVDIAIDDGGHTYEQQRVTLEELFPHLRPGGVYICEDIHGMGNPFFGYLVGIAAALNDFQWDRTHRAIPYNRDRQVHRGHRASAVSGGDHEACGYPRPARLAQARHAVGTISIAITQRKNTTR
jgi:hypothetical protein